MRHTHMLITTVAMLVIFAVILLPVAGCITTRTPDGITTTQVDLQTTIALTQLAISTAEQAWQFWQLI